MPGLLGSHPVFASDLPEQVWQKAHQVSPENERNGFRKDDCGTWIRRQDYGDRNSPYGWESDHMVPASRGGSNNLSNLRPLHWQNNVAKSDGSHTCALTAIGNKNGPPGLLLALPL